MKNKMAVALGRRGGLAKNSKLTKQQRKQIGANLAKARKAARAKKIKN